MISFSEYVKLNLDKAYNHQPVNVPVAKPKVTKKVVSDPIKVKNEYDYLDELNPQVWTARIVNDKKILFYNGHFLNISQLASKLKELYTNKGYKNYGFSKLDEADLIRYTTVRDILAKDFNNTTNNIELKPEEVAQNLFNNEMKDFEWKPQPIVIR